MEEIAEFAKCLTDGTRLKILRLLADEDLCVSELVETLKAPQARISQHLQRLRAEGLVDDAKEGQWVIYSLNREALKDKLKAMRKFLLSGREDAPSMEKEFELLNKLQGRSAEPDKRRGGMVSDPDV